MSDTMRAITATGPGGPEVLVETEVDRPEPGPVEVLVRVHAAAVNPADWKSRRSGQYMTGEKAWIPGWDVSGVVEAVGRGVTLFEPGDAVFGMPRFPHPAGAYAEYVTAPPRHFARKPEGLDHVHAAALPLAALTAWQCLVDTADVRAGQRVLVHAAAGGVGHLAVQIAKALGAYVIGTASAAKHDFVRGLGADEVIDYRAVDFADAVSDVDVAFDTVGGDIAARSLRTIRDGGALLSILPPGDPGVLDEAAGRGIDAKGFTLVEPDHEGMKAIARLVGEGRLLAEVDSVFALGDAAKAHAHSETGRAKGKIVLSVVG